jgi:Xaa-Pro aminopeptidase
LNCSGTGLPETWTPGGPIEHGELTAPSGILKEQNMSSIVQEKVDQAVGVLARLNVDAWLTFVRETTETGDPMLPIILGQPLTWQSALIITRGGERIAIVGKYEDEAVRSTGAWDEVIPYTKGVREALVAALQRLNPAHIAINYSLDDVKADGLSHGMHELLLEHLEGTNFAERLISAEEIIRIVRGGKTPGEIERVRTAIATTDEIFDAVASFARPGVTERAIWRFMHDEMARRGIEPSWEAAMCPIVTTGPHSMIGHGLPSETLTVTPGGILHIDFGVRQNDYCSDLQRCWYVPEPGESAPPPSVQRAFGAVVDAISAAAAVMKPGVPGREVDAAARSSLIDAGYQEYQHATGHQVGRAAHDGGGILGPRWERYGQTPDYPLQPGQVFTIELGVENVDGKRGYLGLEEMVVVTEDGIDWLSERQTILSLL